MTFSEIRQQFHQRFGDSPDRVVQAPGRVNLIGGHTDYNDGFVLPVAIDKHVTIAASRRSDRRVVLYAADFDQTCEFPLDAILQNDGEPTWSDYPKGVAHFLMKANQPVTGMNAVIRGNVPIASGLGSSAAIEVASAFAFLSLARDMSFYSQGSNLAMDEFNSNSATFIEAGLELKLATLCQRAENEFVGVNCGIMDQAISILGKADHALILDCRSLNYERVPLKLGDFRIMVCDTKVKRELVSSEYNKRRAECEKGVEILRQWLPAISALRDVSLDDFKKYEASLPSLTQKRCRYVIEENDRVLRAVKALKEGELRTFGSLMNASHIGLRNDYQVSCKELDTMVEIALANDSVIGVRMTGAGFGGCTVNLVHQNAVDNLTNQIMTEYPQKTGIVPEIYVCKPSDGAAIVFNSNEAA